MLKQTEIELFGRYLSGTADQKDQTTVEQLFLHGESNPDLYHYLGNEWETFVNSPVPKETSVDYILDRIHHLIHEKEFNNRKRLIHRISTTYMRLAAILLLPLIITSIFFFINKGGQPILLPDEFVQTEIYAPLGSRVSFRLPDGTTGWLNGGSDLSYSIPFTQNRKVKLKGEAWFEVAKDENNPFEISAGNSQIKVLGTSFNVSAYDNQQYVEVVLQNGKVEFTGSEKEQKIALAPSDKLVSSGGKITVAKVDPAKYKAWTDGKLVFRGDNMTEVVRRIERWYNVEVELADKELEQFSFRATFEDDSFEEVLKFLSMTSPIRYKIFPRTQDSDGTYKKEKVIIYKTNN